MDSEIRYYRLFETAQDGTLILALVRPETKVFFVSGYNDECSDPLGLRVQGCSFLNKAFTGEDLLSKVGELLGSSRQTLPGCRSCGSDGMA
jgi:hypothetical protein